MGKLGEGYMEFSVLFLRLFWRFKTIHSKVKDLFKKKFFSSKVIA